MNKITTLILLVFVFQLTAASQSCLPVGITFTTQAQIDSFQANYPNCTEIEGHVAIEGADINNLVGLSVLTHIGGGLYIWGNDSLTNLIGLDNVTSLGWLLVIEDNSGLNSLTGLNNVTDIGGELSIVDNNALTSIEGLDNVTSIGGGVFIVGNNALINLTGLENLTSIEGILTIGDYYLGGNSSMTSLSGLNNLTYIGGHLTIENNASLISLSGLINLTIIGGWFRIRYNDILTSLTGLGHIDSNTINNIFISNNSSLSTCEVKSVCDYLSSPYGEIDIHDNAMGCNSQEEVEEACNEGGVSDLNIKPVITIYPNPAQKEFFISTKNGITISEVNIYNQIGQKVLCLKQINYTIDISMLEQGMYIIELTSNELNIRQKLIIK